ncbi:MAG: TetR/AcrR family transcriptional regulator [Jatrophihabitantaceae bacterium]
MTREKRTRLDPVARRAQLIALGVQMLATRTLDALSVEDIARQAGISRGLLFHYFASKQDFHTAVARAAAQQLLERTEPDTALAPVEALRAGLEAFIGYVEENPDSYKSLVRGAASGDAEMRGIFDDTRAAMAKRVIAVVGQLGFELSPRAQLAVHGWVAYSEECTIRWIDSGSVGRDALLEMLTKALPAVVLAATDEQLGPLVSILAAESAIASE